MNMLARGTFHALLQEFWSIWNGVGALAGWITSFFVPFGEASSTEPGQDG